MQSATHLEFLTHWLIDENIKGYISILYKQNKHYAARKILSISKNGLWKWSLKKLYIFMLKRFLLVELVRIKAVVH